MTEMTQPARLGRALELGGELGRWGFALAITGLATAAGLNWIWSGAGAEDGETVAPGIAVEFVTAPPPDLATSEEPQTDAPEVAAPMPAPAEAVDVPTEHDATEAPAPPPEPEVSEPEPDMPASEPPESAQVEANTPLVQEVAALDQGDIPLPRPRPQRQEDVSVQTAAVPMPILPGADLQASRASTPPTETRRPAPAPTRPSSSAPASATASRPAAAAPAAQSAPAAPAVSGAAEGAWQARVVTHLYRRKDYPAEAQRQRMEGTVTLRFSIDTAGRVLSSAIARSSGHALLDGAVMGLIARASPVPAPPSGIAANKLMLVVPIEFKLR